jgi:hypothetical protein
VPVLNADRSTLAVTRQRTPSEAAMLAAEACRRVDLTRLIALRARRGRTAR